MASTEREREIERGVLVREEGNEDFEMDWEGTGKTENMYVVYSHKKSAQATQ